MKGQGTMFVKAIATLAISGAAIVIPPPIHTPSPVWHKTCETVTIEVKPQYAGHPADWQIHLCGVGMPRDSVFCPTTGHLPNPGSTLNCTVIKQG